MPGNKIPPSVPRAPCLASFLFAFAAFHAAPVAANPCSGKQWIDTTIVAQQPLQGNQSDGLGGTGRGQDQDGIGGTGSRPPESGSDLGFIGVIAGFASICVNGQEIHYNPDTTIRIDGETATSAQLKLGQMVSVAASTRQGEFRAQRIDVFNTLNGPLQAIDVASGALRILDQTLYVSGDDIDLGSFAVGEWLTANGSRQPNGDILLTRLEVAADRQEVSLVGPVTQIGTDSFAIFDTLVRTNPNSVARPRIGQEVFVRGRLEDGTIKAYVITLDPQLGIGNTVRRLELQGHIRRIDDPDRLNVGGTEIGIDEAVGTIGGQFRTLNEGNRVHLSASIDADGRIVAERIRIERPAGVGNRVSPSRGLEHNSVRQASEKSALAGGASPTGRESWLRTERAVRSTGVRPHHEFRRLEAMHIGRGERHHKK